MSSRYFRLGPLTRVQEGALGACIYDLSTGDMMRISGPRARLLERSSRNVEVGDLPAEDAAFLEAVVARGLASFYDQPCVAEPLVVGRDPFFEAVLPMARVNFGTVELGTECNLDCVFCPVGDDRLFRRTGCKRWGLREPRVQPDEWDEIVRQIACLGAQRLHFSGGEPLLYPALFERLVGRAREEGIGDLVLLTNGTLLDARTVRLLAGERVQVRVQLFGCSEESYRAVTGREGAFADVLRGLVSMERAGVSFSLSFLVTSLNEHECPAAREVLSRFLRRVPMTFEYLYPHPANPYSPSSHAEAMLDRPAKLMRVSLDRYCDAERKHLCFGHQVAITADGFVLPCPMARAMPVGDWISSRSVAQAVQTEESQAYRSMTKQQIEGCADCELRFGCDDCRPLEYALTGDVRGMATCARLAEMTAAGADEARA